METLQLELSQYKAQLSQIQLAISDHPCGPERDNLIALEKDIHELIKLTKDSLQETSEKGETHNDAFEDEYKLFQAELGVLNLENEKSILNSQVTNQNSLDKDDLNNDLKAMEGTKCQAPFKYPWTDDVTYHNALISSIENLESVTSFDEIKVRVMFTNPTHKKMLPCPYYLNAECKFNDEKCRFSHGEVVHLNSLRDYREPEFSKLSEGTSVLAKKDDGLWYRGTIKSIDGVKCTIKFESNSEKEETQLQNILPLDGNTEADQSDEDSCNDEAGSTDDIVRRILMDPPSSVLGGWEKFTKGFGSRIMAKMGYIHGSGLGKEGNGRVEPVPAVILPVGKSLDHCMMLREQSGGEKDFFKAEKRMKQLRRKHEKMLEKGYKREKEKTDVFVFLNKNLGQGNNETKTSTNLHKELKNESQRSLNVTGLQLAEEAKKIEKEIKSLANSLSKYSSESKEFNILQGKLVFQQKKLSQLKASEQKVTSEQERRRDTKKLTVF